MTLRVGLMVVLLNARRTAGFASAGASLKRTKKSKWYVGKQKLRKAENCNSVGLNGQIE